VLFLEHVLLYRTKAEVPEDGEIGRLGVANVIRNGEAATVVATMAMVPLTLAAADTLQQEGIRVEVIDPCTLYPYDLDTIASSVRKTGRLAIIQDTPVFGGLSAELVAQMQSLGCLQVPAIRVGLPPVPFPQAPHLGASLLPTQAAIEEKLRELVRSNP
jgi:pyruvate dehydrogenase E1 component beta subunit